MTSRIRPTRSSLRASQVMAPMVTGRNRSAAKKTGDIMSVVRQAARKPGLANTSRGISAHEPARRSITTNPTSSSMICGGPNRTPKRLPLRLPCSDTRDVATVRAANSVPHATATIHGDRPQPRRSAVGAQLTANRSRSPARS